MTGLQTFASLTYRRTSSIDSQTLKGLHDASSRIAIRRISSMLVIDAASHPALHRNSSFEVSAQKGGVHESFSPGRRRGFVYRTVSSTDDHARVLLFSIIGER